MKPKPVMKKKLRPKGCRMTISGRHIPQERVIGGSFSPKWEGYCKACGKVDDTGKFAEYLYGKPKKIDDRDL